ncbi:MAG: hypothetical protein ACXVAX_03235 [Pseudobdellovibrio sp.]
MRLLRILILAFIGVYSTQGFSQVDTVTKEQRVLLAVVNLTANEKPSLKKHFHTAEEEKAYRVITEEVTESYSSVHILYRKETDEADFLNELQTIAQDSEVKAIDLIFYTHGHNETYREGGPAIGLYNPEHIFARSSDLAPKVKAAGLGKLRVLYSDACWSSEQNADWLAAGFLAVAGSKLVDANQTIDLHRFLRKWKRGESFGEAIDFANQSLVSKLMDKVLKGNSTKIPAGELPININSAVQLDDIGEQD